MVTCLTGETKTLLTEAVNGICYTSREEHTYCTVVKGGMSLVMRKVAKRYMPQTGLQKESGAFSNWRHTIRECVDQELFSTSVHLSSDIISSIKWLTCVNSRYYQLLS